MKIKGFLALFVLASVLIFFLLIIKSGKEEKVVEDVKAFSKTKQKLTKTNMAALERMIVSFIAERGRAPNNLKELQLFHVQPVANLDAWGTEIKFERLSEESFRLTSAGDDRIFKTSDDIVVEY